MGLKQHSHKCRRLSLQKSAETALLTFFILITCPVTHVEAQLPSSYSNLRCFRSVNITGPCVPLTSRLCLSSTLPFSHTSTSLAGDSQTLDDVYEKLRLWSGLQNIPQCWSVVQPFLCSVYLPRCLIPPPPYKCLISIQINTDSPDFKYRLHTTGRCEPPLVRTDDPGSWYNGVDGCGVPCDNPLFTPEQHREVHNFVAVFGSLCLVCTLFTVLTFIIDWKNANRYPSLILFFINACFFLGSIGWLSQFVGNARKDIVCRRDGTVRRGEPHLGSNESISCTVVFVIVYYFLVAGVSWFVMLAFAWYLTFTALGTPRDALKSKTAYFHLISWCLPLVLTIICLAISEIDGDSVSGICFVGVFNHGIRALFVLVPVGLVIVIGTFFLLRGVNTLIKIKKDAPAFIPEKTFSKIRDTILRLGIFTAVALIFVFITFAVHVYIFANESRWKASFRDYMYCIANVSVTATSGDARSVCVIEDRPSLIAMEIHIFAFFGAGIAMSSWSWTHASFSAWERFFRWIFHKPSNKPVKLKRHRMIAQAFEKRKEINQGRVSISYRSSHDDPLGMKFDLNSGSDDELSSNFAMAMPKLVCRRGGLIYPGAGMGRRYSDSDIASVVSTRRVSLESQLMEFREQQFYFIDHNNSPIDGRGRGRKKMKKKKRNRLNRIRQNVGPVFSGMRLGGGRFGKHRKGSDSSVMSQMSAQSVRFSVERNSIETTSLASNIPADIVLPAVTRRSANDGPLTKTSSRIVPYLDLSPSKKATDFSIFSAKSSSVHSGMGAADGQGGVAETSIGMESHPSLPGAPEESHPEMVSPQKHHSQQQKHHFYPFHPPKNEAYTQPNGHPSSSHHQQQQQKRMSSKTKQQTQRVTVETHLEEGILPLHALMADISGGNWGVLLGKSGSSSGSDAGGRAGGHSAYMGGGNAYTRTVSPFINIPQMSHMGGYNPYMAGATQGNYPYMNGIGDPYMNGLADPGPYMGVTSMQMAGAKPKVKGQWGHFPYYASDQYKPSYSERNQERRMDRERRREREMRRPNQAFFNHTFHVQDDDIESISA
ncbi:unnamed protein product [Candidula unifasciata]|uniref:Protein smoothened n=1 Tax=Candidula unifasciata TaxID=100452 RepID=A0A8S3ZYJ2_9EUPU|nr:unnamed protein product [Candidula unifasciata]